MHACGRRWRQRGSRHPGRAQHACVHTARRACTAGRRWPAGDHAGGVAGRAARAAGPQQALHARHVHLPLGLHRPVREHRGGARAHTRPHQRCTAAPRHRAAHMPRRPLHVQLQHAGMGRAQCSLRSAGCACVQLRTAGHVRAWRGTARWHGIWAWSPGRDHQGHHHYRCRRGMLPSATPAACLSQVCLSQACLSQACAPCTITSRHVPI